MSRTEFQFDQHLIPAALPFGEHLGRYDGFLFDCDGTLVNSMGLHYHAWVETLRACGAADKPSEEEFLRLGGMPGEDVARVLCERFALEHLDQAEMVLGKRTRYLAMLADLEEIPAVTRFARFAAKHFPVAIVSGGHRAAVSGSLHSTGLDDLFDVIVTPELVERGKPAPDMYLLAAERLGLSPSRCLVFEDGEPGIIAARAAGMDVEVIQHPWTSPSGTTNSDAALER